MIAERYINAWKGFARELDGVFVDMGSQVEVNKIDLHDTLRKIYGVPYEEIRSALLYPKVNWTSENIGSVTGIFFEQAVSSLAVPFIKSKYPNAQIGRNACDSANVRSIARDPDLYVKVSDIEVVIEMKVSPKKRDLEYVKEIKEKFNQAGIGYFFVGGYVAANRELLNSFKSESWACFLEASRRNEDILSILPAFDTVMKNAVYYLGNAHS